MHWRLTALDRKLSGPGDEFVWACLSIVTAAFFRLLFGPFLSRARQKTAFVVPGSDPGGLGDDALARATVSILRELGMNKIIIGEYGRQVPDEMRAGLFWKCADQRFRLDGLATNTNLAVSLMALKVARAARNIVLNGADVLDGHYSIAGSVARIRLAELLSRCGCNVVITGFSWNEKGHPRCLKALKRCVGRVKMYTRDPASFERLYPLLGEALELASDVAFLLQPTPDIDGETPEILHWIERQRSLGRTIAALNMSRNMFPDSLDLDAGEEFFCDLLHILVRKLNLSVVLMPHDYRGEYSDLSLLKGLWNRFSAAESDVVDRVHFCREDINASFAKYIAGQCAVAIVGRFHLAIAALGQGVPVLTFEYQDKLRGLFDILGIGAFCLRWSGGLGAPEVAELVEEALAHQEIRLRIQRAHDTLVSAAQKNFEVFERTLGLAEEGGP